MSHVKRFEDIPMSKAMRGICKEEDYAFLGNLEKSQNQSKDTKHVEDEWRGNHEDRVRRREEREKKEQERLRQIEEMRKEKEQQWKEHVGALAAEREATMKERAVRLRDFRSFQKKVLEEELAANKRLECDGIEKTPPENATQTISPNIHTQ
ncbi:uncharacterized protein [Paramormyrops kingsleyae]|uniref:uncharacterized protein n=1 Tax=Paramormyrops kingsleyae TaxID=1676925 RepID=UPI000CD6659C|nr:vicilin-like seed storage protein At2g18540 [Paramormyrops kingsleyae]